MRKEIGQIFRDDDGKITFSMASEMIYLSEDDMDDFRKAVCSIISLGHQYSLTNK